MSKSIAANCLLHISTNSLNTWQGFYRHRRQILKYFKKRGISSIFLFRKNILRRMISVLANSHDKDARSLNGTHQSHVYSRMEVSLSLYINKTNGCEFHLSSDN